MTTEIYQLADRKLMKTFFISPDDNICFHGDCNYFCDVAHPCCGNPDTIEGTVTAFLPVDKHDIKGTPYPWRREYSKRWKAEWLNNPNYCEEIKKNSTYSHRMLDIMDLSVFDFLIDNWDRHRFDILEFFGKDAGFLHLDHGRGFGTAFKDDIVLLGAVRQCCMIREKTLDTLLKFHTGEKLSNAMRRSLSKDPTAPVLWEPHLTALDRRVGIILQTIRNCTANIL